MARQRVGFNYWTQPFHTRYTGTTDEGIYAIEAGGVRVAVANARWDVGEGLTLWADAEEDDLAAAALRGLRYRTREDT